MHWQHEKAKLWSLFDYHRVGIVTDFDGTLSHIVPNPPDAKPTERNRELLQKLHGYLALVAVVSGRGAADVRERAGLPELMYAGNHGLERWQDGEVVVAPAVQPYLPNVQKAIAAIEPQIEAGMMVEDKGATISVHYRNAADPDAAQAKFASIIQEIAEANDLRVFEGRRIFELRPPLEMNKGTVFKQLVEEFQLDAAVYIGDDTTDADALKMAQTLREAGDCYAFGVGVDGDDTPSVVLESSDVMVSGVSDVESFLAFMLDEAIEASSAS